MKFQKTWLDYERLHIRQFRLDSCIEREFRYNTLWQQSLDTYTWNFGYMRVINVRLSRQIVRQSPKEGHPMLLLLAAQSESSWQSHYKWKRDPGEVATHAIDAQISQICWDHLIPTDRWSSYLFHHSGRMCTPREYGLFTTSTWKATCLGPCQKNLTYIVDKTDISRILLQHATAEFPQKSGFVLLRS